MYTSNGESHYESLQAQFNKRVGRNFHSGSNYTWSKTLVYSRNQWVSDKLLENIAGGSRPQAVNVNFAYSIPGATRYWNNFASTRAEAEWFDKNRKRLEE